MKVEVLVATMHQTDESIIEKLNIQTDAVIINQCDTNDKKMLNYNEHNILFVDSTERGLSRSRNMAISNATGDVCVLCDDDEVFVDGYEKIISDAFLENPTADIIVFNVNRIDKNGNNIESPFKSIKKVPRYKTYGSVHIAFRRERIVHKGLWFDVAFGTGSGVYKMAEDALFFMGCHKTGLRSFTYPAVIATVMQIDSSWFCGYDEQYFYDVGAYLAAAFPKTKVLMKYYYPIRLFKKSKLSICSQISLMNIGMKNYKQKKSYSIYLGDRK